MTAEKRTVQSGFLAVFLLSAGLVTTLNYHVFSQKKDAYYAHLLDEMSTAYGVITSFHAETARVTFDTYINRPEILDLYQTANSEDNGIRNAVRKTLLAKLGPLYERLKLRNVWQLHFHLPNSESFLRLHRPEKYGDSLKGVRYSVDKANAERVVVSGFEEGRILNGFRNVFPLIRKGEHLGSVEISMESKDILGQMERQFHRHYAFLLRRQLVEKTVFPNEQSNYRPSDLSDDYLYEQGYAAGDSLKAVNAAIKPIVREKLKAGTGFVVEAGELDKLVVFFPIKNVEGHLSAYVVSHNEDATIRGYYVEFIITLVGSIAGVLIITVLFYLLTVDISDRKRAEETLKEKEHFLKTIFDGIQDPMHVIDRDFTVLLTNKKLLEMKNVNQEDIRGQHCYEAYQGRSELCEQCGAKEVFQTGKPKSLVKSLPLQDGTNRYFEVYSFPLYAENGEVVQVIEITRDITRQKHAEEDLILALEKAEESNRLKTAFLNNMSHEIRTPMNGILGFTELLKEDQLTDKERQEYLGIIEKGGHRLLTTINDIIDISRIEAGEVKITKTRVQVNNILEEQCQFFLPEVKAKGIELVSIPGLPDEEAWLITDQHKLEGILINLIKNAIKFTHKGSITLGYTKKIKNNAPVMEFFVKDTGIGIPQNKLRAVFRRFEQVNNGATRNYEGSGLGLAITQSYVEMLGGSIELTSEEGVGSTFTFSLPFSERLEEDNPSEGIAKKPPVLFQYLTVIVAEDDESSKMLLKIRLKNAFRNIIYVRTGKEAVDQLRKNPDADLILMDIQMPEMSGYDATREIRKFNSDVVIIAQTAFALSGNIEEAREAGCNDVIAKPIDYRLLFEKIEQLLSKNKKGGTA